MYNYLTTYGEKEMIYNQNRVINGINENILNVLELTPTNNQKSFYGRAKVIETGNRIYLLSYTTLICYWDRNTSKFGKLWDGYSVTTMKHINSFMDYLGFRKLGGKSWWNKLNYGFEYSISELLNI